MHSKVLIDALVRQTTILLAQLSTAAGIRAPLAHIADQVFLELTREIETQGVGRKVAADMFGMALRSYLKKVRRLEESATVRNRTLWEAVFQFIQDEGGSSRASILARFSRDDEAAVGAVLNDLVTSSLVYVTGRGLHATYGVTPLEDRRRALAEVGDGVVELVWLCVCQGHQDAESIARELLLPEEACVDALNELVATGRASEEEGVYRSARCVVPLGTARGWEAAVYDHFRAMALAIGTKASNPGATQGDLIGGSTATFELGPEHPQREEVLGLLSRTRAEVSALFSRATEYNDRHPPKEGATRVTFYFGQHVTTDPEP